MHSVMFLVAGIIANNVQNAGPEANDGKAFHAFDAAFEATA